MKKALARWLLRLTGWQTVGTRPTCNHYVLIAAPHTSNWDFPLMLISAAAFDIKVAWMAKHSLFYPPMGWILPAMCARTCSISAISTAACKANFPISSDRFESGRRIIPVVDKGARRSTNWTDVNAAQ
jgi:hypothetical protein